MDPTNIAPEIQDKAITGVLQFPLSICTNAVAPKRIEHPTWTDGFSMNLFTDRIFSEIIREDCINISKI